jgi:LmbE family N-acetylglucosaminyl deacetylase
MIDLLTSRVRRGRLRILCIGAHCDDIEIGCGGLLLALRGRNRNLRVDHLVLSAPSGRRAESADAQRAFVAARDRGTLRFADFPDGLFPSHYSDIKSIAESIKAECPPDIIFCHERDDRHQDHRLVNEIVWNTFRNQLILEYEIPKWDGGLGQPNVYVPLTEAQAQRKARYLVENFRSQTGRHWFSQDTFLALSRLRGIECRAPGGHAEGFHLRKARLTFG